jgi:hypothetical protein
MTKAANTASTVAEWMLAQIQREQWLYQETAVLDIMDKFGEEFVYYNEQGNPAIGKDVLKAFLKLTGASVVWQRSELAWRMREKGDEPGRMQP